MERKRWKMGGKRKVLSGLFILLIIYTAFFILRFLEGQFHMRFERDISKRSEGRNIHQVTRHHSGSESGGDIPKKVKYNYLNVKYKPVDLPDLLRLNLDDSSLPLSEDPNSVATPRPLLPNLVPTKVHFVWCSKRILKFNHYLAVLSAIRALQPTSVILHYEDTLLMDKNGYNLWVEDLKHDFSFFIMRKMTDLGPRLCSSDLKVKRVAIVDLLRGEGGIYVGENTWLLDIPASSFNLDLDMALAPTSTEGYVILRKNIASKGHQSFEDLMETLGKQSKSKSVKHHCLSVNTLVTKDSSPQPRCLIVTGENYMKLYPKNIMERNDTFGRISRSIFYGTSKILKPEPSFDTLVPNILHMVWFSKREMKFIFYLSVLSALFVLEVDKVYIHGDCEPRGIYWKELQSDPRIRPRVIYIERTRPVHFYQNVYKDWELPLFSDFLRTEILIKYGGFYADTDAVWVKPFTKEDRAYDCVASFDWVQWSHPFPETINTGISYAKRNAPFWRLMREGMRRDHTAIKGFTGVSMPYKIWEKHPNLLKINPHIQAICYKLKCHPTWVEGYHNGQVHHLNTGSLNNWREDVHALHWTAPDPPEYGNMTALMAAQGLFADVGRMILTKAGLIDTENSKILTKTGLLDTENRKSLTKTGLLDTENSNSLTKTGLIDSENSKDSWF